MSHFDVFLSYSHHYAEWVEALARRLEDDRGFRVWLDRWNLIPGQSWQQGMAQGLNQANTCAVCLGEKTPRGWFRQEIEKALDYQTRNDNFRVIPILLRDVPEDTTDVIPPFLNLRTWADFREGRDTEYAFHVLCQGILGQPVGRWPGTLSQETIKQGYIDAERKLKELRRLKLAGEIPETVVIEFHQKILSRWFEE